jgi:hypothetical protein
VYLKDWQEVEQYMINTPQVSFLCNKNIEIKMAVNIFLEYIPYQEADSQ